MVVVSTSYHMAVPVSTGMGYRLFIYLFIYLFINPHPSKHSVTREIQKRIKQRCAINGRHRAVYHLRVAKTLPNTWNIKFTI